MNSSTLLTELYVLSDEGYVDHKVVDSVMDLLEILDLDTPEPTHVECDWSDVSMTWVQDAEDPVCWNVSVFAGGHFVCCISPSRKHEGPQDRAFTVMASDPTGHARIREFLSRERLTPLRPSYTEFPYNWFPEKRNG